MRVLVTGATGFIGTRLCELLINQAHKVRGISRSGSGVVAGVDYQANDFTHTHSISESLRDIDCVIHLAGRAHVLDKRNDEAALYRFVNCDATLQFARQALEAGVRRFVFISSIGVNGHQSAHQRFTEDSIPTPATAYARSKLEAEEGLKALLHTSNMQLVIIRPPLVYGADAPGNFRTLLKVVDQGIPSPFALVRNARSLISVDNLALLISLAAQHPDAGGQLFLASDGSDVSTDQILAALAQGMGGRGWSIPVPRFLLAALLKLTGKGDLYTQLCGSLTVDLSKARRMLGYEPDIDTLKSLVRVGRKYRLGRQNLQ